MLRRACGARWSRLAPVVLLALLVSLAAGVASDDVGIAALELDGDTGLDRPAPEAVGAGGAPLAPHPSQRVRPLVADEADSAGWTTVTPADRAPPRG